MKIVIGVIAGLSLALAGAACSKKPEGFCDKYASMEVKCNGGEGVRAVAKDFCESAQKDRATNPMSTMIGAEAECAQTETSCDAYAACIEKKKETTILPGM